MTEPDYTECDFSGLAKAFCSHCTGDKLGDEKLTPTQHLAATLLSDMNQEDPDDGEVEYEIVRTFKSMYHGVCTLHRQHTVRRGDLVAIVQRSDNPMLPVKGVACKICVREYPDARR